MGKALAPVTATIERLDELADDGDDLDEEEIRQVEQDIAESDAQIARGEIVSAEAVMANVRRILYG